MTALTTISRVRDRMGFTAADLADPILIDVISDQQAFVSSATAGRDLGFPSRPAERFAVRTRPQWFDLGASGGPLEKGAIVW